MNPKILKKGVYYQVDSSNIKKVAHIVDVQEGKVVNEVLLIEFKNQKRYEYYFVPNTVVKQMLRSDSMGKAFAELIKGKYQFNEITQERWDSLWK